MKRNWVANSDPSKRRDPSLRRDPSQRRDQSLRRDPSPRRDPRVVLENNWNDFLIQIICIKNIIKYI